MNTQVDHRTFTGFNHFVFHLFFNFRHHLFDTGRMDTSVLYQLVQCQTGNLAANRVKAGKNDRFGGIVDNDLNTGSCFQGTDVTAFTSNDTSFDLIRFDMEYGNGVFDSSFSRYTLDRLDNDLLCFFISRHLRFFHDLIDIRSCFRFGFVFQRFDQAFFRLIGRKSGKGFQLLDLPLMKFFQILFSSIHQFQLSSQIFFHRINLAVFTLQIFLTLVECQFTLFQLTFGRLDLCVPCRYLFFQIRFQMKEFFLYFQQFVFLDHFRFLLGFPQYGIVPRLQKKTHAQPRQQPSYQESYN